MPGRYVVHQTFGEGTFTFSTVSAAALWNCEVSGQISDGTWENASPKDHWIFWSRLAVAVGAKDHVDFIGRGPNRTRYGITRLPDLKWNDDGSPAADGKVYILRDRMLAYGRMAKGTGVLDYDVIHAAEYMPPTLQEWVLAKATNTWERDFVARYMDNVTLDTATDFYASEYALADLKVDLKRISNAMRAVEVLSYRSAPVIAESVSAPVAVQDLLVGV